MTNLSVNLNKVALVRNSRPYNSPDLLEFASISLEHGAHGLTIHPRPDQRHIRFSDVKPLFELCSKYGREFNIEGNPFFDTASTDVSFVDLVIDVLPTQCTLVPDSTDQQTSDHGWDLTDQSVLEKLIPVIELLQSKGIRVSLFVDPDPELILGIIRSGTDRIELYTEPFARTFESDNNSVIYSSLNSYVLLSRLSQESGIGVNAGHDLNLDNLTLFLESVPNVLEVSIGHALTVDAFRFGYDQAVLDYLIICNKFS